MPIVRLEPLPTDEIEKALSDALEDEARIGHPFMQGGQERSGTDSFAGRGDLRGAYNFIETIVEALPEGSKVTEDEVAGFCRERSIRYDRDEDEHYDTASAFIKSMRK